MKTENTTNTIRLVKMLNSRIFSTPVGEKVTQRLPSRVTCHDHQRSIHYVLSTEIQITTLRSHSEEKDGSDHLLTILMLI